jgi:hypothetical protein
MDDGGTGEWREGSTVDDGGTGEWREGSTVDADNESGGYSGQFSFIFIRMLQFVSTAV